MTNFSALASEQLIQISKSPVCLGFREVPTHSHQLSYNQLGVYEGV